VNWREIEEKEMPHVIVKLWPGKSERQKARLSEQIAKDVMNVLNYGEESVSIAIEEVEPEERRRLGRILGRADVDRQYPEAAGPPPGPPPRPKPS
jgi:phenylpyruvate tautomerase PptA (4-oxalocrotonate tautomerase family)